MRLRDWDPGIFGLTWIRLDLYHYDTSEAMGSIKGEWHLGIFGKAQEIEEIRVVMVAQRIWILPRSGVEIGNSVNHLSDLGGIWLGSVEEILEIMVILFQIFIKMVTRGFGIVGQLVGKGEDTKNGEMARKRLKISVPHFDNSDLIKSYALTLVGRCMNPEEQKVDALLVMLPKIWKVEERMRVVIDGAKELCFETTVDFKGGEFYEGEEAPVLLKYDKLFGFCKLCFKLCHDEDQCPLNPNPSKKKETKDGTEGKREDRARSYKGVEPESKWVKVPERGSKRPSSYRGPNRGEEERARSAAKGRGEIGVIERVPRNLHKVEKPQLALPEPNGVKLAMSGASATAMDLEGELGDSTEIENLVNGLEQAMDLVGNGNAVGDNVTMKLDGSVAIEGRKEELGGTDEDMRGVAEGEEELGGNGDQDVQAGEEEKKKGARKVLFKKPPGIAIGTSKLRLVQAVLSPRKNGASMSSKRQGGGEGSKQTEEKGPLNPKNSAKPG
ncbi:hypothetical protein Bca52824_085803 [Brassica carinata]|uniref:DUF4283 domain-containing protein n=1 Tax=Brassica carinata TaxID=52824 RepID=A0A8X7P7D8_BRACI|nr:hypothetical protein Bca52824_085803 [Brassica carinata]